MLDRYGYRLCEADRLLARMLSNFWHRSRRTPKQLATEDTADGMAVLMNEAGAGPLKSVAQLFVDQFVTELAEVEQLVSGLPMKSFRKQLARVSALQETPFPSDHETEMVRELLTRFRDDLEDLRFVCVDEELAEKYYEPKALFGPDVEKAFPSSSQEIADAGRCIALNQGTAAVFHCMRALEPALIALGRAFKVDVKENWNDALNNIEDAYRDRSAPKPSGWTKDDGMAFAQAIAQFFHIKNAWRNHTMHLRLRYSTPEAQGVFDSVRQFMVFLAARISEDAAWGELRP
jgi:hypothetical protein